MVYQAYRPEIARFAAANGYFGDGFSLNRMSWIKPNFLWMMHRSGWAQKQGQEHVLAVRLHRENFDAILAQAVPSSYAPELYASREAWSAAVAEFFRASAVGPGPWTIRRAAGPPGHSAWPARRDSAALCA